jgi:arginine:pyruvate transaminase
MTAAQVLPSKRIAGIAGDGDGWELYRRSRAMVADGLPVIELTIGEHDIPTDPRILDAMHAAARGGHVGYPAIPGTDALRAEVASRVAARTGVPTTPENVLITPGGQAGLFAAHMAACEPGDVALHIDPYYATYPGTLRAVGARPIAIPTRSSQGFQPQARDIEAHVAGASSLLINTPNNPTGGVYSRETLNGIADVVRSNLLWLISDEVYDTQVWDGAHISPRSLPEMAERTLVVGSLSKSHAMTGSRIGWVVGPAEVIAPMIDLSTNTTYGVPGFVQDAALFALQQGTGFEDEIAAPFRRRRDLAVEILGNRPGLRLLPTSAAMYVMLDIRQTGLTGIQLADRLLDDHQIAVMPGESFGPSGAGHIRVALTIDDARLAEALDVIARLAREIALGS